jgi:hypothetical protein
MSFIKQMSFKDVTNNSGISHQSFQKTIGMRLDGQEKLYSIKGHSLAEDKDNFYVTINKLNNDLLSRKSLIVNRENLGTLLENGHLLVVNNQSKHTLSEKSHSKKSPSKKSPSKKSPSKKSPSKKSSPKKIIKKTSAKKTLSKKITKKTKTKPKKALTKKKD